MLGQFHNQLKRDGQCIVRIKVRPNAAVTTIKGILADGTIKIDIAAVPEDGKANAELIEFLASEFGIPKTNVEMVSGQTVPRKCVRISR